MKKYIFCFDGTGKEPNDANFFEYNKSITNIAKLYMLLGGQFDKKSFKFPDQKIYYYKGVGTGDGFFKDIFNQLSGRGFKRIIKKAKDDLKQYQEDDEIYVLGFSRGAAIARLFADSIKEHNKKVKSVKFVGLFDTVYAVLKSGKVGVLRQLSQSELRIPFESNTLAPHIEHVVHALSLDERRNYMQPTLFNKDSRITEVWFAGAHSDVGGGFWFDGLSDITLNFMLKNLRAHRLEYLKDSEVDYKLINENYSKNFKTEKTTKPLSIYKDDVNIFPFHKGRSHFKKYSNRSLIKIFSKEFRSIRNVVVLKDNKPLQREAPTIHYTVKKRFDEVPDYRPFSLRNKKYRIMKEDGSIEWCTREGISDLRGDIEQPSYLLDKEL